MTVLRKTVILLILIGWTGSIPLAASAPAANLPQEELRQRNLRQQELKWRRFDVGVYFMEDDQVRVHQIDQATSRLLSIREGLLIAERLVLQNRPRAALERIQRAIDLDPQDQRLAVRKLRLLISLQRYNEALKLAEAIRAAAPEITETYLLQAGLLEQEQRLAEASDTLRQALIHEPKNVQLLQALGQLAVNAQNWDAAIEAFDRIVKIDERQIGAFYLLGNLYLIKANEPRSENETLTDAERRELLEKAARNLELAIKLRSQFPEFYLRLGVAYGQLGDTERVLDVYRRALLTNPRDRNFQRLFEQASALNPGGALEAYIALAAANPQRTELKRLATARAVQDHRLPLAIKLLKELLEEDATDLQSYLILAPLLMEAGQHAPALELCQTALLLDEANAILRRIAGECHFLNGEYQQAVENLEFAVISPLTPQDALLKLYYSYERLELNDKASEVLQRIGLRFGEGAPLQLMLGALYDRQHDAEKAVAAFEKALELDPQEKRAYSWLAQVYLEQEDNAKLEKLMDQGRRAFLDQPIALEKILGDANLASRRYAAAATHYQRALASGGEEIALFQGLFTAYRFSGQREKIDALMKQIEQKVTNTVVQRRLLASMHYELGDFAKAEQEARQGLITLPMIAIGRNAEQQLGLRQLLALSLAEQKKTAEVKKQLQILERDLTERFGQEVMWLRCQVMSALQNFDAAIEAALDLSERYGPQPELELFVGAQWYEKKDLTQAERVFREAIANHPLNADAYNFLGYMLAEQGIRLDEAQQLVEQALTLKPQEGYIIDSLGWIHYQRGEYPKAVELLEQAVKHSDPDTDILEHLGDAYAKVQNKEKAILYWRKALDFGPEKKVVLQKIKDAEKK